MTYDVTMDTGGGSEDRTPQGTLTFELLELKYFGKEKPIEIFGENGRVVASATGRGGRVAAVRALLRNEIAKSGCWTASSRVATRAPRPAPLALRRERPTCSAARGGRSTGLRAESASPGRT